MIASLKREQMPSGFLQISHNARYRSARICLCLALSLSLSLSYLFIFARPLKNAHTKKGEVEGKGKTSAGAEDDTHTMIIIAYADHHDDDYEDHDDRFSIAYLLTLPLRMVAHWKCD